MKCDICGIDEATEIYDDNGNDLKLCKACNKFALQNKEQREYFKKVLKIECVRNKNIWEK